MEFKQFLLLLLLNKISLSILCLLLAYAIYSILILAYYENEDFKFKSTFDMIKSLSFILLFGISIIFIIAYRRFSYFGSNFDLYSWYVDLMIIIESKSIFSITTNIIFFFCLMFLFLVIAQGIKDLLYIHFLKFHFYLLKNEYPLEPQRHIMDFKPKNSLGYYNFAQNYYSFLGFFKLIPYYILKPLIDIFYKVDPLIPYGERILSYEARIHSWFERFFWENTKYYAFYILLLSFFYDLTFNNMVINKFFFIFPFAFIYYLIFLLYLFFARGLNLPLLKGCILYLKKERYVDLETNNSDNLYIFSNGIITDDIWLEMADYKHRPFES